ncbi:MAG: hypothetical protein AAF677_08720 [Pseudomonadota bacterium]
MRRLFYATLAALGALSALATAASAQIQPINPMGIWRCVVNGPAVSIDVQMQVNPDQTLFAQGTYILNGTSAFYTIQGGGQWLLAPPDASSPEYMYRFQIVPQQQVAAFPIFVRPTGDPSSLYNVFQNPQTGGVIESACQRIG